MNAISKMPKDTFGGSAALQVGSYDQYRGEVDFYGPISSDGDLKYRLVGAYQQADSYIDFAHDDRTIIAPTLQYSPVEGTTITARVNYQRFDFAPYFGIGAQFLGTSLGDPAQLVASNFRIPDVPRSRTGNAPSNDALKEATIAQVMLDQDIGSWKLRGSLQLASIDARNNGVLMFGTDRNGFTDTLAYARDLDSDTYSGEVNLFGDVEAFGRKHTLFVGMDFAEEDWSLFSQSANYVPGSVSGFSIFNPDYSLLDIPTAQADFPTTVRVKRNHRMQGVTAQAMLRPADRVTLALGTRYSHDVNANQIGCCGFASPLGAESELREDAFTYQAGLTFAITPAVNLYASYGTTFEPQSGTLPSGAAVDPEIGKAVEVGFKADVPEHKFSYSAALFKMERTNIAQGIAGTPYVSLVGIQSSKGIEFDFQGEVVRGWEVYGSLAAMDAEYTQGEFKGVQPSNAPKFGASLFSSYEFQQGAWRGFGFGGGVVHKAGRKTTDINSYGA
ncbi:TonB-dependent siderophore receptor, partial [Steroidobacter sp.]|uniref:TonB-dependent siderophore receptor n=1 Tax=Steroidobacter sp. TaxID=1978227 RepID=UPI001A4AF4E9